MSRFILTSILLFTPLIAAAQSNPVVTSITPSSGPDSGGLRVSVNGNNLASKVVCILPCPTRVIFGDVGVDVVEETDTRVVAVTPAHAPGTVDVTVRVAGEEPVVVKNGFTFTPSADAAYDQVLLPIYVEGVVPGANGTQWATDFWLRNDGSEPVTLAPWECPPPVVCPPVFPLTHSLAGGLTLHDPELLFSGARTNPSQLLYISGDSNVSMSLRVADISRNALNGGTDLPVVRENELLRNAAQLFNVPLDAQKFRVLLRIYDVAYTNAEFAVRIFPQDDDTGVPVHNVNLNATTPQTGAFRNEAAYAQLDVTDLLKLRKAWPAAARIEVQPMTAGSRFWAVVSLTNNQTELVTLVTPQ